MATIWLNQVQEGLDPERPLFQTWNPLREPGSDLVVAAAQVARPVVTVPTRDVPKRLTALLEEPGRRIWPVGSYAEDGIPLLGGCSGVGCTRGAAPRGDACRPDSPNLAAPRSLPFPLGRVGLLVLE